MESIVNFASEHKFSIATGVVATPLLLYGVHFFNRPRNLPPGPKGYPYIGSLLELSGDVAADFERLGKKYGDIFSLWTGGDRYVIVLNSYEVIKEAYLTNGTNFVDRERIEFFGGYDIEDNLFNSPYDEDYRSTRKTAIQCLRKYVSTNLESVALNQFYKLDELVKDLKGSSFVITDTLQLMITNVISAMLFGRTFEFESPDLLLLRKGAVDVFCNGEHYLIPSLLGDTLIRKRIKVPSALPITRDIRGFIKKEIEEHLSSMDKSNPRDIIDEFLITGFLENVGIELFCNNILLLMPDSINSGCLAIEWMICYLICYPSYIDRIRKEIDEATISDFVVLEHRPHLPLLECFMTEVLRLRLPVVMGHLNKTKALTKLCGYDIPENSRVLANYSTVHMDPKMYPNPSLFEPERFLKNGKFSVSDAFVPFGMGRRKCIGEHFSKNLIFLIIGNLIKRYDITSEQEISLSTHTETGMNRPEEFRVRFKPRE